MSENSVLLEPAVKPSPGADLEENLSDDLGEDDYLKDILADFSDELRLSSVIPDIEPFVNRCSKAEQKKKLVSLMNTLILAERALGGLRDHITD